MDKITSLSTWVCIIFFVAANLQPIRAQQESTKIKYKASVVEYDKKVGGGAMRLLNNVEFRHAGAIMYCDSAYLYNKENSFEAFYNVYINQGDTLHLYGDYLEYNGNTKLAKMRSNVRLKNKETELFTNALDYDMGSNIGFYRNNADIFSGDNELTSKKGYYYADTKHYLFQDSVVLINPDYIIYSDTLKYMNQTSIAEVFGPTTIVSDSNTIYCEHGWFNTIDNTSRLTKNNRLEDPERILWSDTLLYDRDRGIGEAFSFVTMFDKEENMLLKGHYAFSDQRNDKALLTDSALFIQISEEDSLYLHADTIQMYTDTVGYRVVRGYYKVKVYRSNMQAMCDSLVYNVSDSIIRLFHEPVLWSEQHQITGNYIEMLTDENSVNQMNINENAMIISQNDTARYNQIKGKNMVGYLRNSELYRINVMGNGQTVYYAQDNEEIIGVNKAVSSDLVIYLDAGEVNRINFKTKPDATLYPLGMAQSEELVLKGFQWLDNRRPKSKHDIFRW
ncbi:MAG: organic solvent tolerance protein OstA [Bacteroidetes bacterium]|jgi:lipopolysaccharide export system protein LptA|nr:organic solvent tolerance protein OstA [Bacteroidota bacterium]